MKSREMIIVVGLTVIAGLYSCEKESGENETKISSYNSSESHNTGENCMDCHKSGKSGEGWFTVAGTVYQEDKSTAYPNATVKLYTGANETGSLKATLEVDKKGNFYTTENIDFSNGLYVSVEGSATTKHMDSSISTGKCNSCHGQNTGVIWTK